MRNEEEVSDEKAPWVDYEAIQKEADRIAKQYKANPTIQNYVDLKRKNPNVDFDVCTCGGIEWLLRFEGEVKEIGIDPNVMASALDADENAHQTICIHLLEKIIERKKLEQSGHTHSVSRKKAVSDIFVNYIIAVLLDSLSWTNDLNVSRALVVLIKLQLGVGESLVDIENRRRERKSAVVMIAGQLAGEGEEPSYRRIAKIMGVEASTVMRWFSGEDLQEQAKTISSLMKELRRSAEEIRKKRRTPPE